MQKYILLLCTTFILLGCDKGTQTQIDTNTYKAQLTKAWWQLAGMRWVVTSDTGKRIIKDYQALSECTKADFYKFNDWIVSVPNARSRECDTIPPESGHFKISSDGKVFTTSFMYKFPDSVFVLEVFELSDTRFHVKTQAKDSVFNRNNTIEFVFTR